VVERANAFGAFFRSHAFIAAKQRAMIAAEAITDLNRPVKDVRMCWFVT